MLYKIEPEIKGIKIGNIELKFKEPRRTKIVMDNSGKKFARIFGDTILISEYIL